MGEIKMVKGEIYFVKVTKINPCVKKFKRQGVEEVCRHDIEVEDKAGNTMVCEFISESEVPMEFAEGVWQYVRCKYLEAKGAQIEPADEPPKVDSRTLPEYPANTRRINSEAVNPVDGVPKTLSISGNSMAFAVAYAKDLKVAEIKRQHKGYRVSEKDLKDIEDWGKIINDSLVKALINN